MMESENVSVLNRRNISQNSSEVHHIMAKLTKNKESAIMRKPPQILRRVVSPEIEKLSGQIQGKLAPAPFSQLSRTDPGYGTPQEGSLTAARGQQAHRDICTEVVDMCQVIWDHATMSDNWDREDNIACILFGNLFSVYSKISGNVRSGNIATPVPTLSISRLLAFCKEQESMALYILKVKHYSRDETR